jgi:hypothetical protein
MELFNRKEEVIDIQLTQYGKYLLSLGKFKPDSYAFFDNDIIYDTEYAGFGENQTLSEDRIKETPRTKEQRAYSGAETRMRMITMSEEVYDKATHEKAAAVAAYQPVGEKVYTLSAPLGTSAVNSRHVPAWRINLQDGVLAGSSAYVEGRHELTKIAFESATKTDYEDSTGSNTKFITLSTARPSAKTYKFYFDAGNSPAEPATGASNNIVADSIDITTTAATKIAIATKFSETLNKIEGFEAHSRAGEVFVKNTQMGIVTNSSVSTSLSDAITVSTVIEGKEGANSLARVPQLDCELKSTITVVTEDMYDTGVVTEDDLTVQPVYEGLDNGGNPTTYGISEEGYYLPDETPFEDNSFFKIDHGGVILDILEINAPFMNENYDLEIFEIVHEGRGEEGLRPLKFSLQDMNLINDIAYDSNGNIIANKTFDKNLLQENQNFVDYYLDISVDDEIQVTSNYALPIGPDAATIPDQPGIQIPDIPVALLPINDFSCPEDQIEVVQEDQGPDDYEPG